MSGTRGVAGIQNGVRTRIARTDQHRYPLLLLLTAPPLLNVETMETRLLSANHIDQTGTRLPAAALDGQFVIAHHPLLLGGHSTIPNAWQCGKDTLSPPFLLGTVYLLGPHQS